MRWSVWALGIAALLASGCGDKKAAEAGGGPGGGNRGGPPGAGGGGGPGGPGGRRGPMAFPVEVEVVQERPVEFSVSAVGSVEAFETVQVTARVGGAVEKVGFTEGQAVKKGDVLVEIEPQRYQLAVRAAEATVKKARAGLEEAQAAAARREEVNEKNPGLIVGEQLEAFRTRAQTASADLAQAQVALEQAQLNLRDAYVRAPLAGTLQTRTVQTGQYVQPGTVLATLVRRDPLLLRFQVPEADAARLSNGMPAKFLTTGSAPQTAKITHVGAQAATASRMVPVTAEVSGEAAAALRPGAFAEVTVPIGAINAPVIPQTAVRPSERGFLAYVIADGKAQERVLKLGMRTADGRVEVREGIKPGDRLVVRGAEALKDGAQVRVAGEGEAAPAGPPRGDQRKGREG